MPALVSFDTIPEMFTGVTEHYRGNPRAALRYKDTALDQWIGNPCGIDRLVIAHDCGNHVVSTAIP
jgi:hypothetical protein